MNAFLKTICAGAMLASVAVPALAQDVTLRFQHFVSNETAIPKYFIIPWGELIEEESNGRIDFELYPSMQLGGAAPALYQQIADGVVDGGWFSPGYTPGRFPGVDALQLPFITSMNAEESSRAAFRYYQEFLEEEFSGVKVLALHVHGRGVVHTRGVTVETLEDMAGLKLRGPSQQASALLEAMGATPIGMPVPAFPEALSKGVVDGGVIPWEIVPALRVHELADSHTEMGGDRSMYNTVFVLAMNLDSYNNLPDDLRAVIDANSGLVASAWAGRAADTGDIPGREETVATGNTMIQLDDAETARWAALADPVIAEWIASMEARNLPGAQMVARVRELIAEEAGE
ncbi:TRAP-type C4-dicarboxylate transport system, substrate-binding protein [Monaibacterium marinum]|uniref:TRAP-type C4-dicarboxylate transport system, substrate-binding protein n=1 Tax=Pontivivens marinum TaxID=1690039 RepID=A0A2C9CVB6_9RHOB|nr:TRAP transporter substrate-binding protein [Monaibacterium marinum]SOH95316.1 TRAP-type C4-dicarboxylate transport system, substrate-binding protein [Monaibacterium marinum]